MKRQSKNLVMFILLSLGALNASAATIGPAGCGLGNMLLGGKDNQIVVATINGTGTQTFGILSGTSNCVDSGGVAKLEVYVEANRVALANDVARGSGQTLTGLNHVLGCGDDAGVSQTLRANYGEIFADGNSAELVSRRIRQTLKGSAAAKASCARLS